MKQFLTVLKFELGNYFQNKSFLITTLIIALLAIGAVAIPPQIPGLLSKDTVTSMVEGIDETSRVGIVDADDVLYQQLPELTGLPEEVWVEYGSEEELNQKIQDGSLDAGFVIESPVEYKYVVENNSMYDMKSAILDQVMQRNYEHRYLEEKGLDLDEIREMTQTQIHSEIIVLGKDSTSSYWYTYVLIFALYFLILLYGQMIAVSVTTEKSNRAIEILVTSVNSNSLIAGKILAGAASGILQLGVILGSIRQLRHFPGSLGKCTGFPVSCTCPCVGGVYRVWTSGISSLCISVRNAGCTGIKDRRYQQKLRYGDDAVCGFLPGSDDGNGKQRQHSDTCGIFYPIHIHQCNAVPGHHGKRGTLGNSYIRRDPCSDLPWSRYSVSEDLPSWYADVWKSSKIYHRFKTAAQ